MVEITPAIVKKVIVDQFPDTKFTCGDVLYAITSKYTRSILGTVRNVLVQLTKERFIDYRIEMRGVPHINSDLKRKGAVFFLRK